MFKAVLFTRIKKCNMSIKLGMGGEKMRYINTTDDRMISRMKLVTKRIWMKLKIVKQVYTGTT